MKRMDRIAVVTGAGSGIGAGHRIDVRARGRAGRRRGPRGGDLTGSGPRAERALGAKSAPRAMRARERCLAVTALDRGRRRPLHLTGTRMNVIPLAADSLGVRSVATYVECGDTRIVIDPGASLGRSRFNLPPADVEWEALKRANDRISGYADAGHDDLRQPLPRGPLPLRPGDLSRQDGVGEGSQADARAGRRASARPSCGRGSRGGCRLDAAEGRRMETPDAMLSASPPLSHGPDGTDLGYVIALTVTDRREGFRFVHASDVQGPLSPVATAYLIRERPDLLYLSGPPAYLERELGSAVIDRGHRQPVARHRRDGLPRDHGPSRRPRRPVPRAISRALGERLRRDGGGLPRARRRGARVHSPRSLGAAAKASGRVASARSARPGRGEPRGARPMGRRTRLGGSGGRRTARGNEGDRGAEAARGRGMADYVLERRFWLPRPRPEVFAVLRRAEESRARPAPGGAPAMALPRRPRRSRRAPCSIFAFACSDGRSAGA